jgi:hypothetical protein
VANGVGTGLGVGDLLAVAVGAAVLQALRAKASVSVRTNDRPARGDRSNIGGMIPGARLKPWRAGKSASIPAPGAARST